MKSAPKQFIIIPAIIIIDQLSKYIIRFFGGFYICNSGISFGIHLSLGIFYLLWIIIIVGIIFLILKSHSKLIVFGLILIISGAFSNIIDRLFFGCVIDFINIRIWPIFNIADIFISAGAILLITKNIFPKKSPMQ